MTMSKKMSYMEWLHELSTSLYAYNTFIDVSARDTVRKMYDDGLTVKEAAEKILQEPVL